MSTERPRPEFVNASGKPILMDDATVERLQSEIAPRAATRARMTRSEFVAKLMADEKRRGR